MSYINLTISDFLGIFMIGFPVFLFCTNVLIFGLFRIFENFFFEGGEKIFHHHLHYSSKDKQYAPPRR